AKIVLFEGGGDSEFDVRMTCTLFPEFESLVNPISVGSKKLVSDLYNVLDRARAAGHIPGQFFSITDSVNDEPAPSNAATRFQWNVYHIENFLLEPRFIAAAIRDLGISSTAQ